MRQLKGKLRDVDDATRKAVRDEVGRAAMNVQGQARRDAPNHTGYRSSIAWAYASDLTADVGTNRAYAPFLEFGTGPAGKRGPHTAAAEAAMRDLGYQHGPKGGFPPLETLGRWAHLNGIPEDEVFPIALAIRRNGSPARPHLIPALEAERPKFQQRVRTVVAGKVRDASR